MNQQRRNELLIAAAKDVPCPDCGLRFAPDLMDFDHVRGIKLANVSELVGSTTKRLLAEMRKCEVVCCGCHRIRTRNRRLDLHVDAALDYDSTS